MPLKTAMLGLAAALMLAASPVAIAAAQETLSGALPAAATASPRLQLAQDDATPDDVKRKRRPAADAPRAGEDQPTRPRRQKPEAAEGGGEAQPEQRPRKPRPAADGAPDAGQPDQTPRRQQPKPAAETLPAAENPPTEAQPEQKPPRKPRPQPAAADAPDAAQPTDQPKKRRPQPAAEANPDQPQPDAQQPDRQRPRKPPQPAAEAVPDQAQPDQAQPDQAPRRRPPANQADDSQRAPPQAEPAPPVAGGAARDNRRAADLADDELRARMAQTRQGLQDKRLNAVQRAQLRNLYESDRKETLARRARAAAGQPATPNLPAAPEPPLPGQAGGPRPPLPAAGAPNPVVENPQVDANAERRAAALIADATPAAQLGNAPLRGRVMLYRDALSAGNLTPQTQARLRQRLREDSNALRTRIAQQETQPPQPAQPGGRRPPVDLPPPLVVQRPGAQDIPGILADRRQSRDLDERGLNRRILVYRDAANDPRYSDDERGSYRRYLDTDRDELKRRMIDDRRRRYQDLQWQRDNRQLDVNIDVDLRPPEPSRPPDPVIWAAEADDTMIEDQLVARPLRPLPQRYPRDVILSQPEVVLAQPEVRAAIPSVELDTVHFGFNEDFVREEEITNLDRIGRIIEKIVVAHPNEIFLIEGHTDAVGSDEANLDLSRRRAQAVKQALTQYYQIAPENLTTAGLGERYLKVQTADQEEENRRVTLRRVTSLIQN